MIRIDLERRVVFEQQAGREVEYPFASKEAFRVLSEAWLQCGWDTKYVYSFTWLGRPLIQNPEDLIRIQEVIYRVKPDVLIETGIAHGGSLVFHASLLRAMGRGRVIGVDVEIRPHNRRAIEAHELFDAITLIEGDSVALSTIESVKALVRPGESVLLVLDSKHTRDHVLSELRAYADLVSMNSYVVVEDGIMERLANAPRANRDWSWNNPKAAVIEFVAERSDFVIEEPAFLFNEGMITDRVSYWPSAYLRRVALR
jgi:cephalosporin hydroxylase